MEIQDFYNLMGTLSAIAAFYAYYKLFRILYGKINCMPNVYRSAGSNSSGDSDGKESSPFSKQTSQNSPTLKGVSLSDELKQAK
jgi:hypothetical protein